jgi:hypothetical protein
LERSKWKRGSRGEQEWRTVPYWYIFLSKTIYTIAALIIQDLLN